MNPANSNKSAKIPLFSPLKSVEFDREKMATEMDAIINDLHHVAIRTNKNGITEFTSNLNFQVAPEEIRLRTYRSDGDKIIDGDYGSYKVSNLTYLEDHPESRHFQSFQDTEGKRKLYLYEYPCAWSWVPGLNIPYIREVISHLPLEYIQLVRSVILLPPAIGPIHVDSARAPAINYFNSGFASITFNVADGGAALLFESENGIHTVDQAIKAWHFDASVPHGTTEVSKPRYQLRVFGKLLPSVSYLDLMDLEHAIWK